MGILGRQSGWLLLVCIPLSGCPDSSDIVPFSTDPCEHEGSILEFIECDGNRTAAIVCQDGQQRELPCGQEATCTLGTEGTSPCGFNGQGRRSRKCILAKIDGATLQACSSGDTDPACALRWTSYEACVGDDICRNGVSQRVICADWALTRQRTCIDGDWQDGACQSGTEGDGLDATNRACQHGATETAAACPSPAPGDFFSQGMFRACLNGQLAHPTFCSVCDANRSMVTCGLNGNAPLELTCGEDGRWQGACTDQDECVIGAVRPTACGLNGRGVWIQTCRRDPEDGIARFTYDGECIEADECRVGEHRVLDTECSVGRAHQRCIDGLWHTLGCRPDCDATRPCVAGLCHTFDPTSETGICLAPSCDDGLQNGDESAVDYGGQSCGRGSEEILCNGRDDDGQEGTADDGAAPVRFCGLGTCVTPYRPESAEDRCGPSTCIPGLPSIETPGNGIDEDCDGQIDELPVEQ